MTNLIFPFSGYNKTTVSNQAINIEKNFNILKIVFILTLHNISYNTIVGFNVTYKDEEKIN